MTILKAKEEERQIIQKELDLLKNASDRNKWGQFATPIELSVEIAKLAKRLRGKSKSEIQFLDPAIGTGSFYSALKTVFSSELVKTAEGIELDKRFADAARYLWNNDGLHITQSDFTKLTPPNKKFNLILTNPPYVRHHHIGTNNKTRLKTLVEDRVGLKISGLAGLYCHFLLLCDTWLEKDALSIWLVPSEFMDVNYGSAIKEYLLNQVTLIHIHRFCPADIQFSDALVSSAVVAFKKRKPKQNHKVLMSFGGSLLKPTSKDKLPIGHLRSCRKWTQLPVGKSRKSNGKAKITLGDLFVVKRGLATGCNKFFVLPKKEAAAKGIPKKFIKPILPSPRNLPQDEIERDKSGFPIIDNQLALIDCNLPEEEIKDRYPQFWKYLIEGKKKGVHKKYLTSKRSPWYSQEKRDAAPFVCTYMGRNQNGTKPFRFIWNKSNAVAANVYLLIYPKEQIKKILYDSPELYLTVFKFLQNIDTHEFIEEGRVYGGGLHKIEPKELGRVSAEKLVYKIEALQIKTQTVLFQ